MSAFIGWKPNAFRTAVVIVAAVVAQVASLSAECVLVTKASEVLPSASMAFAGRVTNVEERSFGQFVTFSVDRIWKGEPPKQVTIYNLRNIEGITFNRGERYVVFPRLLRKPELEPAGLDQASPSPLGVAQCGSGSGREIDARRSGLLESLGPGRLP
jgi:hypothetical protein